MRTSLSLCALAVLLSACASGSSQPPPQSVTVPAKGYDSVGEAVKNSNPDDIVCTHEKRIGSHMKKANCATAQQREEDAKKSQEKVERSQRKSGPTTGVEPRV